MLRIPPLMESIEHLDQIPELADSHIHIWGLHVPGMLDQLDRLKALLSPAEQKKAERFHNETDRQASIAARGALRILLSGYTGTAAKNISFQQTETGKPFLADDDVNFNVSHSGEWVVLALGNERRIGVDIEAIKRTTDVLKVAERYFTAAEISLLQQASDVHGLFFRIWVRKEAYVKASGSALFRELSKFAVPLKDEEKDGWHFRRLEAGTRHAAAVVTDKPVDAIPCYDFGELKWDN